MSRPLTAVMTCSSAGAGSAPGLGEDEDAVAEGHKGRDRADVRGGGDRLLVFRVDLPEGHVGVLLAGLLVDGGERPCTGPHHSAQKSTRVMPVARDGLFEVGCGQVDGCHAHHSFMCGAPLSLSAQGREGTHHKATPRIRPASWQCTTNRRGVARGNTVTDVPIFGATAGIPQHPEWT